MSGSKPQLNILVKGLRVKTSKKTNKKSGLTAQFKVSVSPATLKKLKAAAAKDSRTLSAFARMVLEDHLALGGGR